MRLREAELKLSASERTFVSQGMFAKRTLAREPSRGDVRERTFAKGDGGENVCEGMFARGNLQDHRTYVYVSWSVRSAYTVVCIHSNELD